MVFHANEVLTWTDKYRVVFEGQPFYAKFIVTRPINWTIV